MSAQQPMSARSIEEAQITKDYQAQIAAAEEASRAAYERELASKVAKIRSDYEAMIESEKAQYDLDVMISQAAEAERAKFTKSLGLQKKQIEAGYQKKVVTTRKTFRRKVQAGIQEAKRIAAREAKTYAAVSPRMLRAYKKTEYEIFEEAVGVEAEVFEKEVKTWQKRAVGEYETGLKEWKVEELAKQKKAMKEWEKAEKKALETEITIYKKEAAVGLEAEIKEWKKEEVAKLEPQLEKWREAWQPKGLAEQMLEWKAPDLPKLDIELFKMPVTGGVLRIGFDLGKFAEGVAEGSVTAAAGVVASGESLAYSIGSLAGIKAPRPPPTLVGGLIQTVPESIGAGQIKPSPQLEQMAKQKYAFTYAAATLLGDLIISYGMGKVAQKVVIEPLAKTRLGTAIGVKFKAVAPKLALRAVYGKKGAAAVIAERQARVIEKTFGAWTPLPAAKIGVPKAALEAKYGMPFYRAETLSMAMPTTEFQRLRYAKWISPRVAIETQLAWELGLAPAVGVKAFKAITVSEMMLQAEKVPVYAPQKTVIFGLKEGLTEQIKMVPTGRETIWTPRGAIEFEQATKMAIPSRLFVPDVSKVTVARAGKFFIGRGVTTTPFEKTLARAIGLEIERAMGGVTAMQLAPQIMKEFPRAAPTLAAVPKAPVRMAIRDVAKSLTTVAPALKPTAKVAMDLSAALGLGVGVIPTVTPALKEMQIQAPEEALAQVAKVRVKAVQIPSLLQVTGISPPTLEKPREAPITFAPPKLPTIPTIRQPRLPKEEKIKKPKKKKKKLLPWERRGLLLEYPVRPAKEVPSFIFEGLDKKSKGMNLDSAILGKRRKKR